MVRVCRYPELLLVFGDDSIISHQTGDPVSATRITLLIQLCMDSRTAISFFALFMRNFDLPSVTVDSLDYVGFQDVSARHRTHYYPLPESDTLNSLEMTLGDPV